MLLLQKSALGRFSFAALKNSTVLCFLHWGAVFLFLFLSGCSSGTLLSDVTGALYKQQFGSGVDATLNAPLNSAFRYLRIEATGGRSALLVLGYIDPHPKGDIEVWYSADKEVVKLQNGRIVGTAGLPVDWRNVHFSNTPPGWEDVKLAPQTVLRSRDEAPGYRYGIADQLTVEKFAGTPAIALPQTLSSLMARRYTWFRESSTNVGRHALPASWYAVATYHGSQAVVYSFQCLEPQFCLSMQRWPVEKEPS